jgi:hypothetical protein
MGLFSHLSMFYETRSSVHINNSDPSNNPNTELKEVPVSAEIRYDGFPNRFIDSQSFEAPEGKGFETARFLIGRAMLDPDATVVPKGS